jgi:hypothetical protein
MPRNSCKCYFKASISQFYANIAAQKVLTILIHLQPLKARLDIRAKNRAKSVLVDGNSETFWTARFIFDFKAHLLLQKRSMKVAGYCTQPAGIIMA